jgi:hypothetical protein
MEQCDIVPLADLHRAQRSKVRGDELAVEQLRASTAQRDHQPGKRDLGCIGYTAEHRFAAEHAIETHAVEAADQLAVVPAFERMRLPHRMQLLVARRDAVADPAFTAAVAARGGTGIHDIGESCIAGEREALAPQRAGKRARQVEPVERQDGSLARFDPEYLGIVTMIGHGKDAAAVGEHQQFGIDDRRGDASVHRSILAKVAFIQNLRMLDGISSPQRLAIAAASH